jgi:hypothetical protein
MSEAECYDCVLAEYFIFTPIIPVHLSLITPVVSARICSLSVALSNAVIWPALPSSVVPCVVPKT